MVITTIFVGLTILTAALMVSEFQTQPEIRPGFENYQVNHFDDQINQTNVEIVEEVQSLERMIQYSQGTHTNYTLWEREDQDDCLNITIRSRNLDMQHICAGMKGDHGQGTQP